MADALSNLIQQNLIILLCFDSKNGKLIRNAVDLELFEGLYKDVARRAFSYIDNFGDVPDEELPTLFDDILEGDDTRKSKMYERFLSNLYEAKETVHADYTINRVSQFIRKQRLKAGIIEAGELLQQSDDDDTLDKAENKLNDAMKRGGNLFHPGILLADTSKSLGFLDATSGSFKTGIYELDKRDLGPARKELHLFVAPPKKGKSWWLVNIGKLSILQRLKVNHITLEMSEEKTAQRYYQSLFSIPKRDEEQTQAILELDELDRFVGLDHVTINPKNFLQDPTIRKFLEEKMSDSQWGMRLGKNLLIKQFPSGSLTVNGLKAYLDSLESLHNFIPDILIIDYPDLMKISSEHYRTDLGRVYVDLRGVGVERDMAVVVATQANRAGAESKKVTDTHISEDFSKIATADCVITYSQTEAEKELGLARLFVANGRNDEDKFNILITQNYANGQFALDSVYMNNNYFQLLKELSPNDN